MSYISVNGVSSAYSGSEILSNSNGSTVPAIAVVSATTYTALSWTIDELNGSNGQGLYCFGYKFSFDGDATTAFDKVVVSILANAVAIYTTEVLVATTLPDTAVHSFYIPFINSFDSADIVTITITPTFAGTAPILTSSTNIYKIV